MPRDIGPLVPDANGRVSVLEGSTMGTTWCVRLVAPEGASLESLERRLVAELDLVILQMSTWESDSVISRYNAAEARTWIDVPAEFLFVLDYAIDVARFSDGAYDPTAGPLVNAWGFGPDGTNNGREHRPGAAELERARARVGYARVEIDAAARRVLQPGGVYLDFSAIAKGFAVDQLSKCLSRAGFEDHLVELGGELRGAGLKPDALPWWVELERPPPGAGAAAQSQHVIALHELSVATSGNYRRFFVEGDEHFSHTIDPRSGEPVQGSLCSVSVIHRDCITADALSTALYVLGIEAGLALANRHAIPALFLLRSNGGFAEFASDGFEAMLQS